MNKYLIFICYLFLPQILIAENHLEYDGFLDTYYAYESDRNGHRLRNYTTQAYYNEEPAINLASLGARLNQETYRARLAIQAGSSVESNYSAEADQSIKYIQEANFGLQITEGLWLDAGIYYSHIGLETWASKDNWAYTRSLVSEYTPYYQSGGKLTYDLGDQDFLSLHLLNGWQNITSDRNLCYGLQYYNQLSPITSFSYSNFIGDESGTRIFNDFVFKMKANSWIDLGIVFDLGYQEQFSDWNWWHGIALLSKISLNQKTSLTLRAERFSDPHQVLVKSISGSSFQVYGASTNLDYQIIKNLFWRNEVKLLFGGNTTFTTSGDTNNLLLVTSISYFFD